MLNRRYLVGASVRTGYLFWFASCRYLGLLGIRSGCFGRVAGFLFCSALLYGMGMGLFVGIYIGFFLSKLWRLLLRRVLLFLFLLFVCLRRQQLRLAFRFGLVLGGLYLLWMTVEFS